MGLLTTLEASVANERPKRGIFGKIALWWFYIWNVLMGAWLWAGIRGNSQEIQQLEGAEAAGAVIGTGLGAMLIIFIWLFGIILFGMIALLTRPR